MIGKTRSQYIDWVKGVGILLVVLGHCIQYGSGEIFLSNQEFYSNVLFRLIYSFHMPMFMMLSGYLFWHSCKKQTCAEIFWKKIKTLGIPIVAWGTIDFFIYIVVSNEEMNMAKILKTYLWSIIQAPWFLWATLMCSLAVLSIRKFMKDKLLIYLIIFLSFFVTSDNYNLIWFKFMYPFFLIGYFCNKYQWKKKIDELKENKQIRAGIFFILLFSYLMLFTFFDEKCYIYTTYISCLHVDNILQQIIIDIFRWGIGSIGATLILYVVYICFDKIKYKSCFVWLGQHSMGVYVLNVYLNVYLLQTVTQIFKYNLFVIFVETLIALVICVAFTVIFKKNKMTNKILLGGR